MNVTCPTCGTALAAANINIQAMTGLCPSCANVFPIVGARLPEPSEPVLGLPERFALQDDSAQNLQVSWRWWQTSYLFLILFCVVWDAVLIFWYSHLLGASHRDHVDLMEIIFPIGHLTVGVGLTWFLIAAAMNRTWVDCDGGALKVRHGPVPWPGSWSRTTNAMTAIRSQFVTYNNRVPTYRVIGVVHGRNQTLLKGLSEDEATWLCCKISGKLGLR